MNLLLKLKSKTSRYASIRETRLKPSCILHAMKDAQWEYDQSGFHGFTFKIKLFLAWIFNRRCRPCSGSGETGYEYREGCDDCYGLGITWNWNIRDRLFIFFCRHKNWDDVWYWECDHK